MKTEATRARTKSGAMSPSDLFESQDDEAGERQQPGVTESLDSTSEGNVPKCIPFTKLQTASFRILFVYTRWCVRIRFVYVLTLRIQNLYI